MRVLSVLCFLVSTAATLQPAQGSTAASDRITMSGSSLGIAWGFLYGYYGVKAETYLPQLRQLGADFTKVYLFWNQLEPEKGKFDWTAADRFVDQLRSPEEGLIAIFASSTWATRRPATMLPPSPAKDPDDYYRFIHALVSRYKGRVRYWQNDCEPNSPVYWSGTKEEFVAELKVFYKAVKDADPSAVVVAGGYDGLFNPPGMPPMPSQQAGLAFFDYVLKEGGEHFDVFDLRLYANPYTIPGRVEYFRRKMAENGYRKPIMCTEYGGPGFFEFPENRRYAGLVIKWTQAMAQGAASGQGVPADAGEKGVADLYARMSTLAPQTQMFMEGCPPDLQRKFEGIQARDLVMRNVLAFSAGVQKTLYWDLWHDTAKRDDMMHLMYGKIKLLEYQDGELRKRYPLADVYERMAQQLEGVASVRQIALPERPSIFLFEVQRRKRPPLWVAWDKRDAFSGEDQPEVSVEWPWKAKRGRAVDALGQPVPVKVSAKAIHLNVAATPVFVEAGR